MVAGPVALLPRAVSVVGGHAHVRAEREETGHLVVRERLRGSQVEHGGSAFPACAAALLDACEGGQLVGERLAGRRAGGEHDVMAGVRGLGGSRLVPPRRFDPTRGVRRPELVGHPPGPVGHDGLTGRQHLEMGESVLPPGHAREAVDKTLQGKGVATGRAVHGLSLANCRDTSGGGTGGVAVRCTEKKTCPT